LPRLYAVLDAQSFLDADVMFTAAEEWVAAGIKLMQYRNKSHDSRILLEQGRELRRRILRAEASATHMRLIINDRADLCLAAEFDGVHVGQDDLLPDSARRIVGPDRLLGVSTHNRQQVAEADLTSADYLAIGPVFATSSRANPDPVIGLEGVQQARQLTRKPLVAIGGITRANCRAIIEAGADSVAVISDLIRDPGKSAEEFLRILG